MDYPTVARTPQKAEPPKRQTLSEWALDVCKVKETTAPYPKGTEIMTGCVDGLVHPEIKGYTVAFKCPLCDRAKETYPTAKKWMGSYKCYPEDEYRKIILQRTETADQIRRGAGRMPDINTAGIGG